MSNLLSYVPHSATRDYIHIARGDVWQQRVAALKLVLVPMLPCVRLKDKVASGRGYHRRDFVANRNTN